VAADRRIPYVDIGAQYAEERAELGRIFDRVMTAGQLVGGDEIEALERELAAMHSAKHVVALNSGTDALRLGLIAMGIGPGDEVITPPNSFVASTAVIVDVGARPVFADVLDDQNIDPARVRDAITPRTKAIMPVHLTGRIADMNPLIELARQHGLAIIEDSAQAIGSRYHGRLAGTFGQIGCFSTHPLKNFNASGDGGFIVTNDDGMAETVRLLRNHGLADRNTVIRFGTVSRMDTLQAAILRYRLGRLDSIIERRRNNVALYRNLLDPSLVFIPPEHAYEFISYHTLVIQADHRDDLQAHLAKQGVGTAIHYPIPIHLQPAAAFLGHVGGDFPVSENQAARILTLPIHPWLSEESVRMIADAVNEFLVSRRRNAN
jgi:dTDP-4-amino-4,6-dideoxygalactose transaminase